MAYSLWGQKELTEAIEHAYVSPCVLPIPDKCEVLQDIPCFVNRSQMGWWGNFNINDLCDAVTNYVTCMM